MSGKSEWINNFAKIWKKKGGEKKFFMSIPLAEPVTIKLQRKTADGFVEQSVTLIPQENDKGYKSVMLTMKKPESYERNGETVTPPESLAYELSLPPQAEKGEGDF